jgi:hypothetical protein
MSLQVYGYQNVSFSNTLNYIEFEKSRFASMYGKKVKMKDKLMHHLRLIQVGFLLFKIQRQCINGINFPTVRNIH